MPFMNITGIHHLRLTVTDLDRSRDFYENVVGLTVAIEQAGDPADPEVRSDPSRLYGGVVLRTGRTLFGLRPVAVASDRFDSERVGLDHLSFSVSTVDELIAVAKRLDEAGIEHGEVTELTTIGISILSFMDPDGIHLELSAPSN
ncbi:VOC family protein [Nocardia sp. CDC160]|uniref:VOC family protein n=1 Tax=Nocardia sp. CDC160 TaxID=3112166 RepID=UPI002DBEB93A|nr:VOC family protein [Nocardia sp. CDC160]MEC3920352.1 VOC family protein [Nocardia sp. CDC160]